ncbi:hypothetical protein B9Z65_8067 [Elsinoe australis]|uniref:Geranylgeranyl transferase type-2 subunit alpha n=1 Tax=Elsinoe australis TaxID=40998 RepID=A0A2P7YVY9_9PEZI|nr:hypothetical protein B9Z65_8067 [Elsinoe australis]
MASHGVARSARRELTASEKKQELSRIASYRNLVSQVQERYLANDHTSAALTLTSTLLSQNPEFYTIWNYRRQILLSVFATELSAPPHPASPSSTSPSASPSLTAAQREISLLIREDLHFLLPLQRYNPKVYWLWNHRSWLLGQATEHLPTEVAMGFWREELGLVEKMLGRDERNFHGWGYRRVVVGAVEELRLRELVRAARGKGGDGGGQGEGEDGTQGGQVGKEMDEDKERELKKQASLAQQEFEYADRMVRANLSNFSAWHHRLVQIYRLLEGKDNGDGERKRMFDKELELVTEGLWVCTGPKDQSLWFYHLDLMATLDPEAREEIQILKDLRKEGRRGYVERQMEAIKEILEDNEDCKWIYQALLDLAQLYKKIGGEVDTEEMRSWLDTLEKLDPLRKNRWMDLRRNLDL